MSNENVENGEDPMKMSKKPKTNSSTSSSPTIRLDGSMKIENFNGDTNGSVVITCEICEKRDFANEAELQSHKKLIHHVKLSSPGKVSLHCAYCNENCKSRTDLENHMKSHSQNSITTGKHKCNICDEIYPTAAVLAEHKLTHCKVLAGRTCMHCKGTINSEEQFISHTQQHSTANGNNANNSTSQLILPTYCIICRQTLVSEMEARLHARVHLQQSADLVPCLMCFRKSERHDLVSGVCRECYRRRSGKASPFSCPECKMKFDSEATIEVHLATAHRQNFTCVKCKISFTNEKDIQRHVATHVWTERQNNECRLCHRVFQSATHLQAHLIEHSFAGRSSFSCYHCGLVFPSAQGLQAHVIDHGLAARLYDCTRCGQKFFFNTELDHHTRIHMEELSLNEGQNYRYSPEKSRDRPPTPRRSPQSLLTLENLFKPFTKFNCSECASEFPHINDFIEHRNRFHHLPAERYVNGEHIPPPRSENGAENSNSSVAAAAASATAASALSVAAAAVAAVAADHFENERYSSADIKVEPKKENESDTEDEQIDVVTTKADDQDSMAEQVDKN